MDRLTRTAMLAAAVIVVFIGTSCGGTRETVVTSPGGAPDTAPSRGRDAVPFEEATLIIETNATDGDAGLQPFLDHDAWKWVAIYKPDGTKMVEVLNSGVLATYGLTELFSESSEPPFEEFPFEEFKKIFPEGDYTFAGETVEGEPLHSSVELSHEVPAGPRILSPRGGRTVSDDLVVRWEPVTEPAGIEIAAYQVLVVWEEGRVREYSADLPADATEVGVPSGFFATRGEYKVEVLAIEKSGNQTLTEVSFEAG